MQRKVSAALVAVLALAAAPAAYAATFLTFAPPAADGSISASIGNNGVSSTTFSDVFNFSWPAAGLTSISFTTIASSAATNINFSAASLNGTTIPLSPTGIFEFGSLVGLATSPGPQQIVISGTSGGSGSYGGVLSFMPATVPEPAAWGMMITGFGGVGALVRRRKIATA
jgi:hypothetical protein